MCVRERNCVREREKAYAREKEREMCVREKKREKAYVREKERERNICVLEEVGVMIGSTPPLATKHEMNGVLGHSAL